MAREACGAGPQHATPCPVAKAVALLAAPLLWHRCCSVTGEVSMAAQNWSLSYLAAGLLDVLSATKIGWNSIRSSR